MRLLLLTNNLNSVNGITTFLYNQCKVLIRDYNYKIYIIYSGGDGIEKFKKIGVKLINKSFFGFESRSFFNFFLSIISCFFSILKFKIDIVNPQIYYTAAYSYYPSRLLNKAFVQTVHNKVGNSNRLKALYGKNYFTVNNHSRNQIKQIINNSKVILIRCPFEIDNKEILKEKSLKVVTAGRLTKEKSFDVFLNAVSYLNESIRNKVKFYIAGEGDQLNQLLSLKEKLNIDIEFTGTIHDINLFYEGTHIFVMSTNELNEGLPLSIIQSALKKNLIISPDFPSIRELMRHGEDGFFFSMGDSKELSLVLQHAIENYDEVKVLAENFYLKVLKEFSVEKNGKILHESYSTLTR